MTAWRRDIHAHPETAFEEVRTAALVAAKLAEWGIEVHRGLGGTGVVGLLRGNGQGARIGLRADMDALTMPEATGLPYASCHPGKFHGCGHDGHTAMLLGAACYLAATRRFAGEVAFIFQPAEEGDGGAARMIADGLFRRFPCDAVYALHNRPNLPLGQVAVAPGPVMAAADEFRVEISGRGGHAAMPHSCDDPVVAAAQLILAWQPLVSRRTDPLDAAVISVTQVQAGSAFNVIPGQARLGGTVRSLRPQTRDRLRQQMERVAQGVAQACDVAITFDYRDGYAPTVNAPAHAAFAAAVARQVVGDAGVVTDLPPSMGAEDFSFMLAECPGAYLWLGAQRGDGPPVSLHNPHFDFNDQVLPIGASLLASLVEAGGVPPR
ncbi:MAG: M20 aminoacylase family protein [Bacteroidales bacterium]